MTRKKNKSVKSNDRVSRQPRCFGRQQTAHTNIGACAHLPRGLSNGTFSRLSAPSPLVCTLARALTMRLSRRRSLGLLGGRREGCCALIPRCPQPKSSGRPNLTRTPRWPTNQSGRHRGTTGRGHLPSLTSNRSDNNNPAGGAYPDQDILWWDG